MNEMKRRLAILERRPVAVSAGDMPELERYNRILAILDEAPDEAARVCHITVADIAKWRAHVERKLAKLEQADNERHEGKIEAARVRR
jgi:hypothetical protein